MLVVGPREVHPGEQVRGDPLKEGEVVGQELGQVDVVDGSEEEHTLVLVGVLELQVPGSSKDRLDGPHAVVIVVL